MSKATSDVDICNLALDLLGQDVITSIASPLSNSDIVCARWYDTARLHVLEIGMWNFAKARAVCPRNSTAPAFGYSDAYVLPNDFVRLRFIGDSEAENISLDYDIEQGQILMSGSGATSINIGYVKDITEVAKFDPLFVSCLACWLALSISYRFTIKNTTLDRLKVMWDMLYPQSLSVNGQQRPMRRIQTSKIIDARQNVASGIAGKYTIFSS
jgi:hypothetical protein